MLQTIDLFIRRNRSTSICDVSFTAPAGQITCVSGTPGAGKTTLLRALSGGLKYRGSILLNNRELRTTHPAELALLVMSLPQEINLDFPFTVREAININLRAKQAAAREAKLSQVLAMLDLADRQDTSCRNMTQSEQQRVAIVRLLCQFDGATLGEQARWLFLDDPFQSLHQKHADLVLQAIRGFAKSGGGVLLATSDIDFIEEHKFRNLTMTQGQVSRDVNVNETVMV